MKIKITLLTSLILVFCPILHAAGASLRGSISAGPNSTPIPNARVVLRDAGHEQVTTSDSDGHYEISALDPALSYSIVVEGEGLRPFSKRDISVHDGET